MKQYGNYIEVLDKPDIPSALTEMQTDMMETMKVANIDLSEVQSMEVKAYYNLCWIVYWKVIVNEPRA